MKLSTRMIVVRASGCLTSERCALQGAHWRFPLSRQALSHCTKGAKCSESAESLSKLLLRVHSLAQLGRQRCRWVCGAACGAALSQELQLENLDSRMLIHWVEL